MASAITPWIECARQAVMLIQQIAVLVLICRKF